jgi:hypothetical protein
MFTKLRHYDEIVHARHTGTKEQYYDHSKKGRIEDNDRKERTTIRRNKKGVAIGIRDLWIQT